MVYTLNMVNLVWFTIALLTLYVYNYILLAMAMSTSPLLVNIPNFLWFFPFMLHKNDHRVRQNHPRQSAKFWPESLCAQADQSHHPLSNVPDRLPRKGSGAKTLREATGCFLGICLQICIQFYVYNHNIHYYIHLLHVIYIFVTCHR